MGLVSGATCRVEVEFKDDKGAAYKRTVLLKTKGNETEDIPLYTNKDNIMGEVCDSSCVRNSFADMNSINLLVCKPSLSQVCIYCMCVWVPLST